MQKYRLRDLRKKTGLKQIELAKKIGVSPSAYCLYESKKRRPKYETMIKIAKFYGLQVESIDWSVLQGGYR